ncbi:nucleotide exchange factor GrpE [Mycoplasmopsis bovirhinis]|uniref:nucleotide exchange factor GrpE n=1 Tax=Mycoplasmopsis bovirhinis TaxID=29553 RepID=UPI000E70CEB4|nr:nucleotide exchange factor GrpE [Mycoplasmopsis bovirhinis]
MINLKIKHNDTLKAKFKLLVDGQEITQFTKEQEIIIGNNEYLPNFDDYLKGRKVKDNLEIKLSFPKNYEIDTLAGKKAIVILEDISLSEAKLENIQELKKKLDELEKKLMFKEVELFNLNETYKTKAKEFSQKTQDKINEITLEYKNKFDLEKQEAKKYAIQSFAQDFAIPFSNFIAAIKAGENSQSSEVKNYIYGFNIISRQFEELLNNNGIELIIPNLNDDFDPNTQEAVDFKESNDPENKILRVVRYGLLLNGRVITPASVLLSKKFSN